VLTNLTLNLTLKLKNGKKMGSANGVPNLRCAEKMIVKVGSKIGLEATVLKVMLTSHAVLL